MTTETPEPEFGPTDVPVAFHLLNGKVFIVEDIGGWQYIDQGIFATGHFHGEHKQRDLVIPYGRIDYMDCDFDALKEFLEKERATSKLTVIGDAGPGA